MSELYSRKPLDYIRDTDEQIKGASLYSDVSEEMQEEANRINAMLDNIDLSKSTMEQQPVSEREKKLAELKAELNSAFNTRPINETKPAQAIPIIETDTLDNTSNNQIDVATQVALREQVGRKKELSEATEEARPVPAVTVQMQEPTPSTNREVSNDEVRTKIVIGILKLEEPDIDLNYVFLPDVMNRFQNMSMQELAEYRDNLINQSKGKAR